MILFSIIIPVYNAEKFVVDTLESVLNQSFKSFEIIIVDDGSTDDTLKILSNFHNNEKIRIVSLEQNSGVSVARNKGLEFCKGEYVLFLDSDDFIVSVALQKLYSQIEKSNGEIDMVSFGFKMKYETKKVSYSNWMYNEVRFKSDQFLILLFQRKLYQCMCSFVCRNDIIKKNNILFDESTYYAEDQEFQFKCIASSNKIAYVAEELFVYNVRSGSAMESQYSFKNLSGFKAFDRLILFFKDNKKVFKYFENYALYFYFSNIKKLVKANKIKVLPYHEYTGEINKLTPHLNNNMVSFVVSFLMMINRINHKLLLLFFKFF